MGHTVSGTVIAGLSRVYVNTERVYSENRAELLD